MHQTIRRGSLKYHAWDRLTINHGDKVRSVKVAMDFENYEELFDIYLDEVHLMKCTGIKDIEIYEDDIVKVMDMTLAVVRYSEDRGAYYLDCGADVGDVGLICQYEITEVIGNIYENPGLMEVS